MNAAQMNLPAVLEALEGRGISFAVEGPDETEYLGAAELAKFLEDKVRFWCERYKVTPEEYGRYGGNSQGHPNIQCNASTKEGRRCRHMVPGIDANNLSEWAAQDRLRMYCAMHSGEAAV